MSVSVPAGVTLEGTTASVLAGSGEVVTLADGARVRALEIEIAEGVGVRATSGTIRVEDVSLHVLHGIGAHVRGASATFSGVEVRGSADASTLAPDASPSQGSYGLVFADAIIELIDVDITDAGPWGVIVGTSTLSWQRGTVSNVVGTSIYVEGGMATLTDVRIENALQGLQLLPPYGVVATGGAEIGATNVVVSRSEGLGVLVDRASGSFDALAVDDARYGGVWIQDSTDVSFSAIALARNGLAGLTAIDSAIAVDGGSIDESVRELATLGDIGGVFAGDGVAIERPAGATRIAGLTLAQNARIGVLVDVTGAALSDVTLTGVSVDGDTLGCLAQDGGALVPTGGWDDGVTRRGATLANDLAQATSIDVVGRIAARNLPQIDPGALGM